MESMPANPDPGPEPNSSESPATVYRRCLAENHRRLSREQRRHIVLGSAKVADFLLGIALAVFILAVRSHWMLLLIPIAIFVVLLVVHERVLRRLQRRQRVADFYARGLARLDDHWAGSGESGDRFLRPEHPYARDLDVFGAGGLFELLCTARTRAGEATLADWLLNAASPETVLARQGAVADLRPRLLLREQLFAAGETVRLGVHPDALAAWGETTPTFRSRWLPWILGILGLAWIVIFAAWLFHSIDMLTRGYDISISGPLWWSFLSLSVVNYGVSRVLKPRVDAAATAIEHAAEDLQLLVEVLTVIERESCEAPLLRDLRASLDTHNIPASVAVSRLERIAEWLEGRHNLFVRILLGLAFYNAQFTLGAERWQRRFGPAIRGWLEAVGTFEALSSLAGYAYEHPADPFPTFSTDSPCFEARDLAHPLLPAAKAVGNDLALGCAGRAPQLLIVSGPNMAGKSTFLRAIGLNAVLAQAGAPVCAASLRLSPLAVGASICVLDSLQGGVSRFYAEIQRLKLLSDLADGPTPLLFLLDELLSGTNSHDRLEGTRHVVTALVRRGGIGLVTTHDLALTAIPEALPGAAANTHFEDSMEDGKLHFDYRLKPGIVQTSNALKLMQSIGLDIPTE
ncbi:MAG: mismatch repair protein [Acidobacteriaceae bacterium]